MTSCLAVDLTDIEKQGRIPESKCKISTSKHTHRPKLHTLKLYMQQTQLIYRQVKHEVSIPFCHDYEHEIENHDILFPFLKKKNVGLSRQDKGKT